MRRSRAWLWGALAVVLLCVPAGGQRLPDPVFPIRDDAGLLSEEVAQRIRDQIAALEQATTAEIGVLIQSTTRGQSAHDYAVRVFNHWGIGKADRDNGVLLFFAIDDRRVELVPGIAYEELFHPAISERLLQSVVVPRMRAGRPQQAVLAIVEEVAREIRIHEGVGPAAPEGTVEAPTTEALDPSRTRQISPETSTADVPAPSRRQRISPEVLAATQELSERRAKRRRLMWLAVALGTLAWFAVSLSLLVLALVRGRMLVPRKLLLVIVLGGGALIVGGTGYLAISSATEEALVFTLVGGIAAVVLGCVGRHICRRCNRWMRIDRDTIKPATYSSSGHGVRTLHCRHCGFHDTKTYTISQRTRSSSGSSSFGSSGGSFGGGSSRGGGGGASW